MSVKLGVTLPQFGSDARRAVEAAQDAEGSGLDSVWVFDHLWPLTGGRRRPILEGWTTLAAVAAATERITVGTLVSRSTLRHPAVLAKMAATVASIAPGRLIVGLGSGDNKSREENEAFGIPYYSGADRTDQLRSTAEICLGLWENREFSKDDEFTTIDGLPGSPRGGQRPELWIGGRGDAALAVASDLGDAWNGWSGSPKHLRDDAARVTAGAAERTVGITWGGQVLVGDSGAEAAAQAQLRHDPYLVWGSPDEIARRLKEYMDAGAEHLILTQVGPWSLEAQGRLAREVKPALSDD